MTGRCASPHGVNSPVPLGQGYGGRTRHDRPPSIPARRRPSAASRSAVRPSNPPRPAAEHPRTASPLRCIKISGTAVEPATTGRRASPHSIAPPPLRDQRYGRRTRHDRPPSIPAQHRPSAASRSAVRPSNPPRPAAEHPRTASALRRFEISGAAVEPATTGRRASPHSVGPPPLRDQWCSGRTRHDRPLSLDERCQLSGAARSGVRPSNPPRPAAEHRRTASALRRFGQVVGAADRPALNGR